MTPEQSRILAAKPLARMRRFAALLNWHGLRIFYHYFSPTEDASLSIPQTRFIVWYMTSDEKFNLQINEYPIGQSVTHQASVKASRYSISNNGWHPFTLGQHDDELRAEAERVRPVLDRRLWKSRKWRNDLMASNLVQLPRSRKKRRGKSNLRIIELVRSV